MESAARLAPRSRVAIPLEIPPAAPSRVPDDGASSRPIMLAIAGDSASGKTTLTAGIVSILGESRVTVVCADDYHRYDRVARADLGITPLHPACNYVDVLEQHMELLAGGRPILKPVYAHSRGTFEPPEYVQPRPYVVVEGLLPLHTSRMRRCFDATIYLDPPEDLRYRWKVQRDCAKRGYTPDQVLAELSRREPDSAAFIRPQRNRADLVVRFSKPAASGDDAHLDARLVLRPTAPHPDVTAVAGTTRGSPIRLWLDRDGGRPAEILAIDGCVDDSVASSLEDALWERIAGLGGPARPALGEFDGNGTTKRSHPLALTQLLVVATLAAARTEEEVAT